MSDAATLEGYDLLASGKVREIYDAGDRLLMVATDRISTYDASTRRRSPARARCSPACRSSGSSGPGTSSRTTSSPSPTCPTRCKGRALLVEKLEMFPVECVVRGYITGSGWKDYQRSGEVCGIALPEGLRESEQLPEPIFTPATKAERRRPRRERRLRPRRRDPRRPPAARGAAPAVDRALLVRRRPRARARDHPGRHQVRVRPRRRRPDRRRRRGAHAGLARASGRPTATSPAGPAVVRQAVRARLGHAVRLGQVAARRRRCPTRSSSGTRALYEEAYERITGEPFANWLERAGAREA